LKSFKVLFCDFNKTEVRMKYRKISAKSPNTELKRQPTEWENTFVSYTSEKGSITRIYREIKKITKPTKNQQSTE
jgi:hypothetical protein